jgi:hypothetical protein
MHSMAAAAGLAVFAVVYSDLSAIDISSSAEILGCGGVGDPRNSQMTSVPAAVLRCLRYKCNGRKNVSPVPPILRADSVQVASLTPNVIASDSEAISGR